MSTYPLFLRNQHWTSRELKGELPRRVPRARLGLSALGRAGNWPVALLPEGSSAAADMKSFLLKSPEPSRPQEFCIPKVHLMRGD